LHQAGVLIYHCMMHGNMKLKFKYYIFLFLKICCPTSDFSTYCESHTSRFLACLP